MSMFCVLLVVINWNLLRVACLSLPQLVSVCYGR